MVNTGYVVQVCILFILTCPVSYGVLSVILLNLICIVLAWEQESFQKCVDGSWRWYRWLVRRLAFLRRLLCLCRMIQMLKCVIFTFWIYSFFVLWSIFISFLAFLVFFSVRKGRRRGWINHAKDMWMMRVWSEWVSKRLKELFSIQVHAVVPSSASCPEDSFCWFCFVLFYLYLSCFIHFLFIRFIKPHVSFQRKGGGIAKSLWMVPEDAVKV
jgi:ABC-type multidrug transport system fused ATPase/permease subunit